MKKKYPKLEPEFKKKWVGALRSGEYVQAEGVLFRGLNNENKPEMCCLGVAEHICGTPLDSMLDDNINFPDDVEDSRCPKELHGGGHYEDCIADVLATMNDGCSANNIKKHSFEEIAQWIEEFL